MAGRLIHYSRKPLTAVKSVRQCVGRDDIGKPRGLWVSVEGKDGWRAWCEAENFMLDTLAHATQVVLKPKAKILRLRGADQIDAFTAAYTLEDRRSPLLSGIDWSKVESDGYHGIVIAPYVWSRRLERHTRWYYGWDCASGCIWNADAVAELRPLGDVERTHVLDEEAKT